MSYNVNPLIVGIGGGSGGGKTLLANLLCQHLGNDQCAILSLDAYYLNQQDIPVAVHGNYDHPHALDQSLFLSHLQQLRVGAGVDAPTYDFATHTRTGQTVLVPCRPFIFVDGVMLYALEGIFQLLDLTIFVDTAPDVRLARRLLRDVAERGRTLDSVIQQYLSTVRPMHNRYVEPHKQRVDTIVSGEIEFSETLPDLIRTLQRHLNAAQQQPPAHLTVLPDNSRRYDARIK